MNHTRVSRSSTSRPSTAWAAGLGILLVAACSGGSGGGGTGGEFQEAKNPAGGTFFVDPNLGGRVSRLRLVELSWGRLVDVHDVDENGVESPEPVFRDFVINENIQTDGVNYTLETNPITQDTRLIVHRTKGAGPTSASSFERVLEQAARGLPPILPKHDDGTSPGPFSFMARNACLVLRFDDCLDDSAAAARELASTVKVLTGYPPIRPADPRILFDQNHGAIVGGRFHSTRILIDMTVSQTESAMSVTFLPVNAEGLPASLRTSTAPNVSIRIPTRLDLRSGQVELLRGLSGGPLATSGNGPVDLGIAEQEIVRALRAGNARDTNNGFLLDLNSPQVVGTWPLTIDAVRADPDGVPGFDFLVDTTFSTTCQDSLRVGDVLSIGSSFLEVLERTVAPVAGKLAGISVRALADAAPAASSLLGKALLQTTYNTASNVELGCWVSFAPLAKVVPATSVSTTAQVTVTFTEPMDPESVTPFDSFMILRGDSGFPDVLAENIAVGSVVPSPDLRSFTYNGVLPFAHFVGGFEPMNVRLGEVTDLAGNGLLNTVPPIDFTLDPSEPTERNSSIALRFSSLDEIAPRDTEIGTLDDLRGQVFYDLDRGRIRPREVSFTSYPVDRTNPVPSIMIPFPQGVQTPLTPLGSKLHAVWRYADLGWSAADETKYNVDVAGLYWSPVGGTVLRDFFEQFEIRLAHSYYLPDEHIDINLLPDHRWSGLVGDSALRSSNNTGGPFAENILSDPRSPQKIVHPRHLGYRIDPGDLTETPTGHPLMPYPMNRPSQGASEFTTFLWRDTAALSRGGPNGVGVPMDIEAGAPLFIVPPNGQGKLWPVNRVPTAGLPLLMEFRCYPTSNGVGLNPLDVSLAINSCAIPSFRAYASGGVNTAGNTEFIDPDTQTLAIGGLNPSTNPPGKSTRRADDNTFYIGQMDIVVRVSRAHTVWIDTGFDAASFFDPVLIPDGTLQPLGTQVIVDYRGATGFNTVGNPLALELASDANTIDTYGQVVDKSSLPPRDVGVFYVGNRQWDSDIQAIDGARYLQMRFSFINNVESGTNPDLSAVGIAYLEQ